MLEPEWYVYQKLSLSTLSLSLSPSRLLYKSVLLLVFGHILWKWINGVDSLGSNQKCRIGYKISHSRVSQCLASIRKLGNRRISEGLRSFKPSKGTNLVAGSCCSSIRTFRICLSQNWQTTRNQFVWKCLQTKFPILWQVSIDRLVALVKNSICLENSLNTLGHIIRVKSYPQSMS